MSDREKLIELLWTHPCDGKECVFCEHNLETDCEVGAMADKLLANGVTVTVKTERPPTDLSGKCGSCAFAKPTTFGRSQCYVECTNADHLSRRKTKYKWAKRQRTCKACKSYTPRRVDT